MRIDVHQGCLLSALLLNFVFEMAMEITLTTYDNSH